MIVKPITPNDLLKKKVLPDNIVQAINTLIITTWTGEHATFSEDTLYDVIKLHTGLTKDDWQVKFDDVYDVYSQWWFVRCVVNEDGIFYVFNILNQ